MGCLFPLWAIVTVAVGTVMIMTVTFISFKKWETIKFLLFWHFDVLTNDDGPENLDDIKFDAFVSYSQADESFVESDIIEYLENLGFKICTHHRDFTPGTNIADAMIHSRHMIIVISRFEKPVICQTITSTPAPHLFPSVSYPNSFDVTDQNRKKFLIPLLYGEIDTAGLNEDLKLYIETHTYIECKDLAKMKKRLRYSMPHKLPSKYKTIDEEPELTDENEVTDYGATFVETIAKKDGSKGKPPEGACGGDIESGTDEINVNERPPLVQ